MPRGEHRTAWVAYLRVSTPEQAERDLSLPAQRHAIQSYAKAHGATIAREFVEEGHSGTDPHRPAFRRMLEDALRPGSDVAVIVVHHSSRFTRDAMEARVIKTKLRRAGIRVCSVSQDLPDDPMGKLMEGFFECIDQYESELNGLRTSAAMAEAVRQGFFPGARPPFGFRTREVTVREGVVRHLLEPDEGEAEIIREIYRLYITHGGAKAVARTLNQRGLRYRTGLAWNKNLVLDVLDEEAVVGTYWWGRRRDGVGRPRGEWLSINMTPIVDAEVYALAQRLRRDRDLGGGGGRVVARPRVLSGVVFCGRCGASCQLETSGKTIDGNRYRTATTAAARTAAPARRPVPACASRPRCSTTPCSRTSRRSCAPRDGSANWGSWSRVGDSRSTISAARGARSSPPTTRSAARTSCT